MFDSWELGEEGIHMNVLFFTPALTSGGAEKTIQNLRFYLQKYSPEIEVYECVMHADGSQRDDDHLLIMKNDTLGEQKFTRRAVKKIGQIAELRKIKRKYGIDICVSFLPGADILNVFSDTGEKKIVSIRNNPFRIGHKDRFGAYLHRAAVRKADQIVALSDSVRLASVEFYGVAKERVRTIYNPTPSTESFQNTEPAVCEEIHKAGGKIIVTAGRLTPQKGQWHLIKAFRSVIKEHPNTTLLILGKGELEARLKECAEQCGIADHVRFLGFQNNAMEYIKHSDIFVFPSIYEGLGNVLIETLALGTPIISADCPYGPREILSPHDEEETGPDFRLAEYGVLVPVDTEKIDMETTDGERTLASAICTLLCDPDLLSHYRKQAQIRAGDFAPETISGQWTRLFHELLKTD